MIELFDVITMNPNPSQGNQSSGNYSVSKCLVYFGFPIHYLDKGYSQETVCCIAHGAMLCVSILHDGRKLWRCEVCNNGAISIES